MLGTRKTAQSTPFLPSTLVQLMKPTIKPSQLTYSPAFRVSGRKYGNHSFLLHAICCKTYKKHHIESCRSHHAIKCRPMLNPPTHLLTRPKITWLCSCSEVKARESRALRDLDIWQILDWFFGSRWKFLDAWKLQACVAFFECFLCECRESYRARDWVTWL